MTKLTTIDPTTDPSWNDRLAVHEGSSFFHTAEWIKVLCQTYGYEPLAIVKHDRGDDAGILPLCGISSILTGRRGVSLPFTDQCEPLTDKADFQAFFHQAIAVGRQRKWQTIELRGGAALLGDQAASVATYFTHELRLTGSAALVAKTFRGSTRRNIRKAESLGVTAKVSHAFSDLFAFYRLNCLTRQRHGLPPQPFSFFRRLFETIILERKGFITLARYRGTPIAGAVFLIFNRRGIFKYGASDKGYQHLRANNLVMWTAIQWLVQQGCDRLDFGRTSPDNQGLLQFKRGWGTAEKTLSYFRYHLQHGRFQHQPAKSIKDFSLFAKLPIPVSRAAGKLLYRHVG